ncbi:hypothetical protein [Nocardioides phosphati]|nr:hypothetical protein [Nocardioides phosphati]
MRTTRAGRPSKGERHAFNVKLSPEAVEKIHLLAQINDRPYVGIVEVLAADALAARTADEAQAELERFIRNKGERKAFNFYLPIAGAEQVFALAQATSRTYQDVLEFLLLDALNDYDAAEMLAYVADGQGTLDIAV